MIIGRYFPWSMQRLSREVELLVCNSVISFTGIYLTCSLSLLNIFLTAFCQRLHIQKVALDFDILCTAACSVGQFWSILHKPDSRVRQRCTCVEKMQIVTAWAAPSVTPWHVREINQPEARNTNWLRVLQPLNWSHWDHPRPKLLIAADPWFLAS